MRGDPPDIAAGVLYSGISIAIKLKDDEDAEQGKKIFDKIEKSGVTADWRYPNVIRVAPVPQYNSFVDVFRFVQILKTAIQTH